YPDPRSDHPGAPTRPPALGPAGRSLEPPAIRDLAIAAIVMVAAIAAIAIIVATAAIISPGRDKLGRAHLDTVEHRLAQLRRHRQPRDARQRRPPPRSALS